MQETDATLPQVIDDCHALLKWLIPALDKFSRARYVEKMEVVNIM